MNQACRDLRNEWLLRGAKAANAHLDDCPACADWVLAIERRMQAVRGLERLSAPAELELRVARELGGDRKRRLERVLSSLIRLGAPAELDRRVEALFQAEPSRGSEQQGRSKAQILRSLDVRPAPDVLERLLAEELAAPERHRAERFSGGLERLRAPKALERRIHSSVRRTAVLRLVLGPLVTLAAAGLVLWLTVRRADEVRHYRFQVVEASAQDALVPLARSLAQALGGAAVPGGPR